MDSKNYLKNIKSKYILKEIFDYLQQKILLKLKKINKGFQKESDIGINDYKKYYEEIEIEIILTNHYVYSEFINIPKKDESYYHIYINDNKNEGEKKNYIIKRIM